MHLSRLVSFALVAACALCFLDGAGADDDDDRYKATLRRYREYLKRPSLRKRIKGRFVLASTKHPSALKVLVSDYGKPEKPKDRVRYLIATICAEQFIDEKHVPAFRAWRSKHRKTADAWLWFHALRSELWKGGLDAVSLVAREEKNPWLRASALHALSYWHDSRVLEAVPGWIDALPSKPTERGIGLQAVAAALRVQKDHRKHEAFEPAARKLIEQLDDRKLPDRSKLVIARNLAVILETDDVLGINAEPWLIHLKATNTRTGKIDERYAPEFIGIRASGDRICYVIDASDSMLKPLDHLQREALRRPTTGSSSGTSKLPWDEIETRFDAARELLKLSINKLKPDKRFAIVLFGRKASLLDSTRGLVPATPKRIAKVIAELDAISAGPTERDRPHGTLRGETNLHGGFDRAFRVKTKGLHKYDGYVSEKMLGEGCDTIFLLSDGAPTWDDYAEWDEPEHDDRGGDPESGRLSGKISKRLNFYGPYVWPPASVSEDVRRMNMFRGAEIHCVGIGEANMDLLKELATIGLGTCVQIGGSDKAK